MAEWFHAKVKFLRQMDNGLIKQISEDYLIDSLSFTEAEGRVMLEVGEGMREVTVQKIARSPIKEVVFYGDTDLWFKTKITYSTMDEDSDKERKVTTYFLVNASNVKEAYERTETHLKDMLVPFQIPKVEESPIVDVFEHVAGLRPGLRRMEKQPDSAPETTPKQEEEEEEECAMHTDSVGAIDPTDGQAHDFGEMGECYICGEACLEEEMEIGGCCPTCRGDNGNPDDIQNENDEDDEPTDLEGRLEEAFAKADGKPHVEVPDEWSAALFIDLLETPAYVRVSDQHSALPFEEFKTWVMAAHELTESQAIELNDLLSC